MLLSIRQPALTTYRVEVSGWDHTYSFFVEKSELEWNEETGKQILLTRSLRPGSIIFVRLLQPSSPERSCSVAYEADFVATTPEGRHQFHLNHVHPRSEKK